MLQGNNSEHGACAREEFALLTVEALFARVWDECMLRPTWPPLFPLCHVAYDERLGYPRRVDTYTLTESGEHTPSITVDSILLDP